MAARDEVAHERAAKGDHGVSDAVDKNESRHRALR
jgi:hypothetical protein